MNKSHQAFSGNWNPFLMDLDDYIKKNLRSTIFGVYSLVLLGLLFRELSGILIQNFVFCCHFGEMSDLIFNHYLRTWLFNFS